MTKPELRKAIRVRLAALTPEAKVEKSAAICRALAHTQEWRAARTVGFFSPLDSEPNVDLLWAVLGDRTVCYPRIHGEDLVFIQVPDREALLESERWNLLEPPHRDEHVVSPGEMDLCFVPGMAFTADGHRMGRGKGYYDRLLAHPAFRAPAFGICFAEQLVAHLPMEAHDRPVSGVFSA
ncbi:MAG: 5-formyltetrahydrofolate cyclo-ligase [Verrucomicrobiota bacterium]